MSLGRGGQPVRTGPSVNATGSDGSAAPVPDRYGQGAQSRLRRCVDRVIVHRSLANDTPYGLTAGVITEDLAKGLEVAARLRTGIVHVNDQSIADEPQAPFGGVKNSGYGRFGGQAGAEAFTDTRWVTAQASGHARFPI
ncbi:aldehyde dehydrogenase [Streptomyces griseoflavus Tu4000]|uniref:Aldehyde dehydrogenase n=1 Tax=Streptomyces griseoflavus Tu4000 TaxID=467200 RepID=D9Y0K2_9ACTN|nr:aldehyde dehydrogenase [Streptomyces griseoflavus Tu4000]